jgi:uncharacterized membrane protein YhiD involved in acid resistance
MLDIASTRLYQISVLGISFLCSGFIVNAKSEQVMQTKRANMHAR